MTDNNKEQFGHQEGSENPLKGLAGNRTATDLLRSLRENTLLITVAIFSFVAARAIVVTRFDLPTTFAVFATVGIPTVVVNTLISAAGAGSVIAIIYITYNYHGQLSGAVGYGVMGLAILAILLAPLSLLFVGGFFSVMGLLSRLEWRRFSVLEGLPRQPTTSFSRIFAPTFAVIMVAVILFLVLVAPPVWLPAEKLKLKNPKGAINVGYVLNEGGEWFSILTTKDRKVIRIRSDNIDERVICEPRSRASGWVDLLVLQLVLHTGRGPLCPLVN